MKLTIDIPAPTHQLELISRLRQKIRNYKTSMKQLQRAHYITKDLLRRAEERNNQSILQARYDALEADYRTLQDSNKYLRERNEDLRKRIDQLYGTLPMPVMDATFTDTTGLPNGHGNGLHKGGNGQA